MIDLDTQYKAFTHVRVKCELSSGSWQWFLTLEEYLTWKSKHYITRARHKANIALFKGRTHQ